MIEEMYVRGVEINYYFVCRRKLWLFSHNINFENESELVKLGRLIHREFYERDERDVRIGPIAIDAVRRGENLEIREVKKSKSMEEADFYQLAYYLYYLSNLGIEARGVLSYPKIKENVEIELNDELFKEIEEIVAGVEEVKRGEIPPAERGKKCRKCAYFEFCFT
ncbi:MAG: CRISPR-associated exonuclease Cas4 [Archaeoglobi archaeon]|nr:CRISPR-associated protein Cas4 [Candidatus Mnemosynella bozhongmuii]MDI3502142.1 CRISPR-associated exonuclease Cas4 [Archaeoglobi archaeon]MDK2781747.1 CRISPR-associated exonuclease Cas4 [Archaeoglobi archaeon]